MHVKEKLIRHPHIVIKKSPIHGYGVFADADIAKGEILEECFSIAGPSKYMKTPSFIHYVFGDDEDLVMIPLGSGCIYNHSEIPNADYFFECDNLIIFFKAIKPIKKGEEIFIYYGDTWFSTRDKKAIGMEMLQLKQKIRRTYKMIFRFSLILGLLICVLSMFKFA